jgi:hypothetical protein
MDFLSCAGEFSSRRGRASHRRGSPLMHFGYRHPGQVMAIGEVDCLGEIGHAPVIDSADECGHDRGRHLVGFTGEFQRRLCTVRSFQHATGCGADRHGVSRTGEPLSLRCRVRECSRCHCPVVGRDACADTVDGIHRYRILDAGSGVVHRGKSQTIALGRRQSDRHETRGVPDEKIHRGRRHHRGTADELGFHRVGPVGADENDWCTAGERSRRSCDAVGSSCRNGSAPTRAKTWKQIFNPKHWNANTHSIMIAVTPRVGTALSSHSRTTRPPTTGVHDDRYRTLHCRCTAHQSR